MSSNVAGLSAVSQSHCIIVDMTPPIIFEINDGIGPDVDFQSSLHVSVNWKIEDQESGIDYCMWAIGTTVGYFDIQSFKRVDHGQSFAKADITETDLHNSRHIYSTVRCFNKAGLPTIASTDGVLILDKMAANATGQMVIFKDYVSLYPVRDECQVLTNSFRVHWDLSDSQVDIKCIQIYITGKTTALYNNVSVTDLDYDRATIRGISLQPETHYNISFSTINMLDIQGNFISRNISAIGQPPVIKDSSRIQTIVSTDDKTMKISWKGVLDTSWKNMYYEVSLGTTSGSANVIQWQETRETSISIRLPDKSKTRQLFLTVTAIDPCGLFVRHSHTIVL